MNRFYENICWRTFFIDGVTGLSLLAFIWFVVDIAEALTK